MTPIFNKQGFSLVEVVLALGVISFAGMALLGVFSLGLDVNRESAEELEATHIAQSLLAERRAAPESPGLLSPLSQAGEASKLAPLFLTREGEVTGQVTEAQYGLVYRITPSDSGAVSRVYLCLFWPAAAGADHAQGRVELFTVIPLP